MPKKSGLCEVMGADEGRFDDVITRTVLALENGARHRIPLLWTLGGATYLVKIPPREQRLVTLLPETIHHNNPKKKTMETIKETIMRI